jgi:uncharacterized membrane protein
VSDARLLVVVYPDPATAKQALARLASLADERVLSVDDAAIVVREPDGANGQGSISIEQTHALAPGEGVVGGGTVGLLLGLALGLPVIGTLAGMAAGGVGAAAIDTGIDDSKLRQVGSELTPGRAALAALVDSADWDQVGGALAPFGGTVLVSEVTEEVAAALERAGG